MLCRELTKAGPQANGIAGHTVGQTESIGKLIVRMAFELFVLESLDLKNFLDSTLIV